MTASVSEVIVLSFRMHIILEIFPGHSPVAGLPAAVLLAAEAPAAAERAGAPRAGRRAARGHHAAGACRRHAQEVVHRGPGGDAGRPSTAPAAAGRAGAPRAD